MAQQDFLPPDFQEELDSAQRRRALAQMFLQQGLTQQPQGQMVGAHYVPASWTQHLAGLGKALMGSYMDARAGQDINATKKRFSQAQSDELGRIQGMVTGRPEQMTPNFVMQPGEGGEPEPVKSTAVPGNPLMAEQEAQRSQFPAAQALGKVLMEARMKRTAEMQKELANRVPVADIPSIYEGRTTDLKPKQTVHYVDGLPIATPAEYVPGGPQPARIGPGYDQKTIAGAGGRPIVTQVNPLTGKSDSIDKAPQTSVSVQTGDREDPYWKAIATKLGDKDAAIVSAGRDAPAVLDSIARMRKLHFDSKGDYTAGPAEGVVRLIRDLASQFDVPLDPAKDIYNAKFQAEFSNSIAAKILGEGRGLSNEDRQALERAFPNAKIPPAMLPAFLNQYEMLVRGNAARSQEVLRSLQRGSRGQLPTATRDIPVPPAKPIGDMTTEELEARLQQLRGGR